MKRRKNMRATIQNYCAYDFFLSGRTNYLTHFVGPRQGFFMEGNRSYIIHLTVGPSWVRRLSGTLVIRICISKNRQHNGQKKKYKRTNNDLQNIHIKIKITRTPLKSGGGLWFSGRVTQPVPPPLVAPIVLI